MSQDVSLPLLKKIQFAVIVFCLILVTTVFYKALILQGREMRC